MTLLSMWLLSMEWLKDVLAAKIFLGNDFPTVSNYYRPTEVGATSMRKEMLPALIQNIT